MRRDKKQSAAHKTYPGINPHTNSHLHHGIHHIKGWRGFHDLHPAELVRDLKQPLQIQTYPETDGTV
jgi:hypothetical protein